jgi:hypothetical protein
MQAEQARAIIRAAARTAQATDALFEAVESHLEGAEISADHIAAVEEYIEAKTAFDTAITTRGTIST